MNTIPVIHLDQWVRREEQASLENFNNSQKWLEKNQGQTPGTQPALRSPDEWESCRGSGEGAAGSCDWCWHWYSDASLVPLLLAHWARARRPEGKETTLLAPVCSISARYLSHSADRWRVLHRQPTMPVGNDLLIFVWFLHPALIEIHTASLAWLSCPLDTDLSQQAQRSLPL